MPPGTFSSLASVVEERHFSTADLCTPPVYTELLSEVWSRCGRQLLAVLSCCGVVMGDESGNIPA